MKIIDKPKNTYVYIHYNDLKPMYVGKGSDERILKTTNRPDYTWNGYRILMDDLNNDDALELEKFVIDTIGWDNLANKKTGPKRINPYPKVKRNKTWKRPDNKIKKLGNNYASKNKKI